jgi:hypothetical protein
MPNLAERMFFGGAETKLNRLGLRGIWTELETVLTGFKFRLNNDDKSDTRIVLLKLLDDRFRSLGGWSQKKDEGIDWTGCHKISDTRVCLGVQIQFLVSARSDLILVDLQYLYDEIVSGRIDVGVMVVPSTKLALSFLMDNVATYKDAVRGIQRAGASHYPVAVLSLEHDGPGPALIKRQTRQGRNPIA